ncbi:4-phosphoerythronate dehydrogenase [uncultured Alistipes sp.]|uniref:4-phosphoerythronate dehydrogenase n=1 Tax=uncultured Alistipes sp. TaxID=538949 RepID=UPI0026179D95|nr:4-phosphoerythronate dehydrogenase [uncultured Alistipes sp.]
MKIIIDEAIPYLRGVLEPYAETVYLPGRAIAPGDVHDADALVIRTRTRCDAALLDGSRVRFIATATIGFDHIDLDYCRERRIDVATAAGCNARGVLQWMGAVLHHLAVQGGWNPPEKSLGIVGAGHVGELVRQYAAAWGFRVVACDPPRAAREGGDFVDLGTLVRQSDLIAFHTPLDAATRHMVDAALLEAMKPEAIVINASRGEVVDGTALLHSGHPYILDVWEHEPDIDRQLLAGALLATPHIAGYSAQGKANATAAAVQALARHFGLPLTAWYPEVAPSAPRPISWEELSATIESHYDIAAESATLKKHPERFEELRNGYAYRQEYF